MTPHLNCISEAVKMRGHNNCFVQTKTISHYHQIFVFIWSSGLNWFSWGPKIDYKTLYFDFRSAVDLMVKMVFMNK